MNTAAEGDVAAPVALDIELLRFRKCRRVAVRRSEAQRNCSVLKDFAPAYLGVAPHKAKQGLHGAFVTQHLLDRGLDQRAIFPPVPPQHGPGGKKIEHIANQVGGGLVAGDQQEDAKARQLDLR